MSNPEAAAFFAGRKKKTKRKSNNTASSKYAELQANDIVYNVVHCLSSKRLEVKLADSAGCPRRVAALTFLRDFHFAYGNQTDLWPDKNLQAVLNLLAGMREEMVRMPKEGSMIACWIDWGALVAGREEEGLEWNMRQINEILSRVKFDARVPEEDTINEDVQTGATVEDPFARYAKDIPKIVESVAYKGKEGATTSEVLYASKLRFDGNPGPFLRSIPELKCRRDEAKNQIRYYAVHEQESFVQPYLAGIMTKGGGGTRALNLLQTLHMLCFDGGLPQTPDCIAIGLQFCGSESSEHKKILKFWQNLRVLKLWGKSVWDVDRIETILSSPLVCGKLNDPVQTEQYLMRYLPALNESLLGQLSPEKDDIDSSVLKDDMT